MGGRHIKTDKNSEKANVKSILGKDGYYRKINESTGKSSGKWAGGSNTNHHQNKVHELLNKEFGKENVFREVHLRAKYLSGRFSGEGTRLDFVVREIDPESGKVYYYLIDAKPNSQSSQKNQRALWPHIKENGAIVSTDKFPNSLPRDTKIGPTVVEPISPDQLAKLESHNNPPNSRGTTNRGLSSGTRRIGKPPNQKGSVSIGMLTSPATIAIGAGKGVVHAGKFAAKFTFSTARFLVKLSYTLIIPRFTPGSILFELALSAFFSIYFSYFEKKENEKIRAAFAKVGPEMKKLLKSNEDRFFKRYIDYWKEILEGDYSIANDDTNSFSGGMYVQYYFLFGKKTSMLFVTEYEVKLLNIDETEGTKIGLGYTKRTQATRKKLNSVVKDLKDADGYPIKIEKHEFLYIGEVPIYTPFMFLSQLYENYLKVYESLPEKIKKNNFIVYNNDLIKDLNSSKSFDEFYGRLSAPENDLDFLGISMSRHITKTLQDVIVKGRINRIKKAYKSLKKNEQQWVKLGTTFPNYRNKIGELYVSYHTLRKVVTYLYLRNNSNKNRGDLNYFVEK